MADASKDWRELAEAITKETDGEKLIGLVNELCAALDRAKAPAAGSHNGPELRRFSNHRP